MRHRILAAAASMAVLALVMAVGVRLRYGGGEYYPDLTGSPRFPESALETVVSFDQPIGNVAVSPDGRIFFTVHPESRPSGARLFEWIDGGAEPFPAEELQPDLFDTPLGVVIDRLGRLWTIDHGNHGLGGSRLLAFDLGTGEIVHDHRFARDVAPWGSFLQDLQVSPSGDTVYIADVGFWAKRPALVVYDVTSGSARRVLERHPSVLPQDWIIRTPVKRMVFFGGLAALKPGVDGIALEPSGQWLYYGAMTHDGLYRVRAEDLRDAALPPAALARRVERFSHKPLSDGLSSDLESRIYITDVEHGAVLRVGSDRRLETLVRTPRIRWADALSFGPRGWLYVADSAIPDQVMRSKAHIASRAPYHVFRFRPGARGIPGQ